MPTGVNSIDRELDSFVLRQQSDQRPSQTWGWYGLG
jgi:hypothetical protein